MASYPLLCWPFWSVLQESPRTGPATAAHGTSSTPTWSWPQPTSPPPDPGWPRLLLYPGSSPTPPVRFLMPRRHHLLNSAPCRDTSGTLVSQGLPTQRLQKEPFNILPAMPPNTQPLSTSHLGKPCPAHSWTGGTQPTPHQPLPLGSPVPPPNPPCSPAPLAQETARLAPAWLPRCYGRSKAPLVHALPELRISTRAPSHLSAQPQLVQLSARTVATHILSQRWHSRDSCSVPCLSPSCDSLTCLPYQEDSKDSRGGTCSRLSI